MQNEKQNTKASSSDIASRLLTDFQDEDVRRVYAEEFINMKIATQIKVLREQRGWTQQELAKRAGMKQERIAVLENVNHEAWTLSVLKRLAMAFDLRINIAFEGFGDLPAEVASFDRHSLERNSFADDPAFHPSKVVKFPSKSVKSNGRKIRSSVAVAKINGRRTA